MGNLDEPVDLTHVSLGCGRNPTQTREEQANSTQKDPCWRWCLNPQISCCEVSALTTAHHATLKDMYVSISIKPGFLRSCSRVPLHWKPKPNELVELAGGGKYKNVQDSDVPKPGLRRGVKPYLLDLTRITHGNLPRLSFANAVWQWLTLCVNRLRLGFRGEMSVMKTFPVCCSPVY